MYSLYIHIFSSRKILRISRVHTHTHTCNTQQTDTHTHIPKLTYISLMRLPFSLMAKRVCISGISKFFFFSFPYKQDLDFFFYGLGTIWHICCSIDACCSFIWIIFQPFDSSIGSDSFFYISHSHQKKRRFNFWYILSWFFPVQYISFRFFYSRISRILIFILFSKFGFFIMTLQGSFFSFIEPMKTMNLYRKIPFSTTKYHTLTHKKNHQPLHESVTIWIIFLNRIFRRRTLDTFIHS